MKPSSTQPSERTNVNTAATVAAPDDLPATNSPYLPQHGSSNSNHHPDHHPDHHSAHHVHSETSQKRIVNRLSRIEGHIRGIKTMVQEDRPCPDVLVQIAAIRGALDRVARIILDEHLSECITRAAHQGDIEAEIDALKAALDRFI